MTLQHQVPRELGCKNMTICLSDLPEFFHLYPFGNFVDTTLITTNIVLSRMGKSPRGDRLVGWFWSARCMFWLSERGRLMALALALATAPPQYVCVGGKGKWSEGRKDAMSTSVAGKEASTHMQGGAKS